MNIPITNLRALIFIMIFLGTLRLNAQSEFGYIEGDNSSIVGNTKRYSFTYQGYRYVNWFIDKGETDTFDLEGETSVDVQWNEAGIGQVLVDYDDYYYEMKYDKLKVLVTPPLTPPLVPPLANQNYIHTITPTIGTTDISSLSNSQKQESITYFDGLGRPMQNIGIRAGGNSEDIITHIAYDDFGRQEKNYLPYPLSGNNGVFVPGNIDAATKNYYTTHFSSDIDVQSPNPYSKKQFEASPLNRVLKQGAPGKDWRLEGGHEIKLDYQSNGANEVKNFGVSLSFADNVYTPTLTGGTGFYNANELYKTITKDENWTSGKNNTTEEFKDKEGRVILKRTYSDYRDTNGTLISGETIHDTYYVYDDYGNLTYVIPPEATGNLSSSSVTSNLPYSGNVSVGNSLALTATNSITLTEFHAEAGSTFSASIVSGSSSDLDLYCYQYKYDHRNRLVEKKLPGKDWEYIVYDKLDRPVLTQDPNLKAQSKWLFTKYDAFSRPVYTGLVSSTKGRGGLQADLNLETIHFESRGTVPLDGINTYYTNNSFPRTDIVELHTINYYDDYGFDIDGGISEPVGTNPQVTPSTATKSLATGSKIRVLGTSNWITNVIYYDQKGRPIYNYSRNNYLGSVNKVKTELDFVGKPTKTTTTHEKNNVKTTIVDSFGYDHQGRLLTQIQKINNQAEELLVSNTYDQLGQLETKGVGGKTTQSRLQTVDYTYNIRGWLKGINDNGVGTTNSSIAMGSDDLFGFKINYNDPSTGTSLYNGNISQTFWKTTNPTDTSLRNYNYSYDALNRLTGAQYSLSIPNRYNENLTYDKNGNIKTLIRTGNTDANATSFGSMDNLVYTYSGNRLTKVEDSSGSTEGFKDGNTAGDDYSYDANGNMTKDLNKGIATDISYNHLNLPIQIALGTGNIEYVYDATGVKQRKIVTPGLTTDYDNGFQYEKGSGTEVLKFFPTSEGYAENNSGTFSYIYQYKDHLGNVRLSYRDVSSTTNPNLQIVEESNYYPFGLKHTVSGQLIFNSSYNYKYQGQERQDELGLNWDSFKYRNYDMAIGRFMSIDPLAEDYSYNSTYAFQENKMGMGTELEGKELRLHDWLTIDSAVNPNGVGAHTIGIGEGLINSAKGLWNAVSNPVETAKGIGNTALWLAVGSQGSQAVDNAFGTNATGAGDSLLNSVVSGGDKLINGTGTERGSVIGEFAGAAIGAKGVSSVMEGVSGLSKVSNVSPNVQNALNTLKDIKANGGTVKVNPMSPSQELNMTIKQGTQKLDLRVESHKLPAKYGGDGVNPTRHMNVDIKGINLPDKGHKKL